jgi:hypothetical protein
MNMDNDKKEEPIAFAIMDTVQPAPVPGAAIDVVSGKSLPGAAHEAAATGVKQIKPEDKGKRGPGRPPKDAPKIDPTEPAPRPRKPTDEPLKDARGAIERAIQALAVNARAYGVEHPESDLGWIWKQIRAAMPEERGRIGAPISESAFSPMVRGPVRGIELLGGVAEEDKATAAEIEDVSKEWSRASTHLGASERVAAVGSAIVKSLNLVIRQGFRAVIAATATPPAKPEASTEAAAFPEEPKEPEAKP